MFYLSALFHKNLIQYLKYTVSLKTLRTTVLEHHYNAYNIIHLYLQSLDPKNKNITVTPGGQLVWTVSVSWHASLGDKLKFPQSFFFKKVYVNFLFKCENLSNKTLAWNDRDCFLLYVDQYCNNYNIVWFFGVKSSLRKEPLAIAGRDQQ